MRAKEFVVNVPIAITVGGSGVKFRMLDFDASDAVQSDCGDETDQDVMMSPQQQELELKKAELGKRSPAGAQLLDDAEDGEIT